MKHLKKSFGENHVLQDISLVLNKGENLVILGQSGSGKSVLIKCIVGLNEADEGKLFILGNNIEDIKAEEVIELRKKIGFLFQSGALYDSMTVRENLEFPLRRQLHSLTKETINSLVSEALENVGLSDSIDITPSELSGGMRKRLGLARTLILKPEIMLYDEPTTGLDPITSNSIDQLIKDLSEKIKVTSVVVTHDMYSVKNVADKVAMIHEGKIYFVGKQQELLTSDDPVIIDFIKRTGV
ncbi:MAG TPA: ABC transporter ATP-binding protein [Ignavibacteriales bacterium]|nr:ABC transporter ATP-binding protein [Ignavibacteriales bacterium]